VDADSSAEQSAVPHQLNRDSCLLADLETFCREHYRDWVRVTMYAGADEEEAKDAVSSALLDLVKITTSGSTEEQEINNDPRKWVARRAIKHFREENERRPSPVQWLWNAVGPVQWLSKIVGTSGGIHENEPNLWEDRQWVEQLFRSLTPKQREAMDLIINGCTPIEIAKLLGVTPSAVRRRLKRAVKRLKKAIQQKRAGEQQPR
jgi:RNA polymerase sigma factor (sigma-70 family)